MKPSPLTNAIFLYCLAVAAEKYGVLVHAFVVLGNHYHAVVSDQHGNIPQFMAYLNRLTATCVNASIGRWENLWANEQPSLVKLDGLEDALRALVYTFTNPLSSYLVKRSDRWPGLRMVPTDLLKGHTDLLKGHIDLLKGHIDLLKGHIEAVRPSVFFREDGPMLERVSLKISRPECFANMTDEQLVATLQQRIRDKEDELLREAEEKDIRFLGTKRLKRQRHTDTPTSREPRRNLSPRVACKNKWRRIELLRRLKQFAYDYREAWLRWQQGFREVIFPPGTYAMARLHNVTCAPAP